MKKKIQKKKCSYTDEPIGEVKVVKDFLPPPEQLILKDDTVKVTLLLSKTSVDRFKQAAEKHHTYYQVMIRALLDEYARRYLGELKKSNLNSH